MRPRPVAAVVFAWWTTALPLLAQPAATPSLRAGAVVGDIVVDGSLDEAAWRQADLVDGLTMAEPNEGVPASAATRVRVLATPRSIYVGIECDDDPSGIVSYSKQRDADLSNEDYAQVVLGPFLDGRSGYVFAVNPAGARYDALIKPGGEDTHGRVGRLLGCGHAEDGEGMAGRDADPHPHARLRPRSQ